MVIHKQYATILAAEISDVETLILYKKLKSILACLHFLSEQGRVPENLERKIKGPKQRLSF